MVVESRLIERGWRRQIKLTLKEGVPCGLHFLYNDAGFWLESMAITKSATKRSRNLRAAESV